MYIGQGECILNFTQQPVTEIDCDVYEEPVIVLMCRVESLSQDAFTDPSVIEIRWYFHNGTEYELTTGVGHIRMGGNGDHVQVTSTLNVSGTSNQRFTFLGEGFYYCLVQMTDKVVVSNSSQRFQVLGQDQYVQAATSCDERTFIANVESCAAYEVTAPTTQHQTTTDIVYDTTALSTEDRETTTEIALTEDKSSSTMTTLADGDVDRGRGSLQVMWIAIAITAVAVIFVTTAIVVAITTTVTLRQKSLKSRKSNEYGKYKILLNKLAKQLLEGRA